MGFEVREDVTVAEMGNFRWLSVAPPYQDDIAVVLMAIPAPDDRRLCAGRDR